LSLILMGGATWALFWAIDNGQFENLEEQGQSVVERPSPPSAHPE
jgi:cbb3-type cytochrome oxidase maturation protein